VRWDTLPVAEYRRCIERLLVLHVLIYDDSRLGLMVEERGSALHERANARPGAAPMKLALDRLLQSNAPTSTISIRLMVGGVFLSEGIQKFLEPASRGAGRFENIGLPAAEILGPFVGVTEITCGLLVLLGLLTRVASIPLIATMLVAIVTTKVPILLGSGFWGLHLRDLSSYGFWSMAHAARTDFAMLLGSIFLLIVGAGPIALDATLARRRER
jgi:putative oxidoreductase